MGPAVTRRPRTLLLALASSGALGVCVGVPTRPNPSSNVKSITRAAPWLKRRLAGPKTSNMAQLLHREPESPRSWAAQLMQQRRRHPRVSVNGRVRIVADTPEGVVTLSGKLVDLSVSGCAIRVYGNLDARREARLELEVDGERVWVPGQIVWTRTRDRAWVVGVKFDRLQPDKQSVIMRLVGERRRHASH